MARASARWPTTQGAANDCKSVAIDGIVVGARGGFAGLARAFVTSDGGATWTS